MNDDSIAKHMYCHVLSVLLTGQKKKEKKKKKKRVSHGISQLRVKRVRGRGLKFTVPPRTAALHRLGFRQHTGTRISTISVKSDYRERLNTLKLKCYFYMPFLFLKCLLNEFKCMLYCKLCCIHPNKFYFRIRIRISFIRQVCANTRGICCGF